MSAQSIDEEESRATAEGPAEPTPVVFIIGAGVVGTTLAAKLTRAGVPVAGLHGRQTDLSELASALSGVLGSSGEYPEAITQAEAVIISVRDSRIAEVTKKLVSEKRLRPNQVLLHTSGNRSSTEMLGAARSHVKGIGTLHPLIAVTEAPGTLENLRGATFGIEGDEAATRVATRLVKAMGGRPLPLTAEKMPLYHAAAVMASNYVVALADLARSMLVSAGVPEKDALPALLPLMTSAVRNLVEVGLPSAMTGPVVRGDVDSVERHIGALEAQSPETLDLYRRLGREVLRIARKRVPDLEDRAVEQMATIFGADAASVGAGRARPAAPAGTSAAATKKKR
jgi:predicted short-subunit dehydrogenase-like oxidoreductase (DUF2520 family)